MNSHARNDTTTAKQMPIYPIQTHLNKIVYNHLNKHEKHKIDSANGFTYNAIEIS